VKQVSITLLRQTWSLIETINAVELLEISDKELVQRLLNRLDAQKPLADQERIYLNDYLHSKIGLIKDTAESRLVSA
jgi:ribosome assembly protein YihI (activator of Der GTPase)